MESWEQSNDPFAALVKHEGTINIKAFETSESLTTAYNDPNRLVEGVRFEETGAPIICTSQELAKFCRAHGIEGPRKPSELRFVDAGHQIRGYQGFKLNKPTDHSRLDQESGLDRKYALNSKPFDSVCIQISSKTLSLPSVLSM